MHRTFWAVLAAGTILTLLAGAAAAQSAMEATPTAIPLDSERTIGGVGFACTGIGQEKSDPRWAAYPVRLEFSNPAGDLLANVAVTLAGASGAVIATVTCEGPWILLHPAAGSYKVDAWLPGKGFEHQVTTFSPPAHGQKIVGLRFPEA